jgi:hypothetical protein
MNTRTDPAAQAPALWLTDDHCPGCGTRLTETSTETQVCQECRSCGWAVTWAPDTIGGER